MGCDIMDFDSVKETLAILKEKLDTLKDAIKVSKKQEKIKILEKQTLADGFWDDNDKSSKILLEMKNLKFQTKAFECHHCPNSCELLKIYRNNVLVDSWGSKCGKY